MQKMAHFLHSPFFHNDRSTEKVTIYIPIFYLLKSLAKVFFLLPAFYLIMWLMKSPKSSEKIAILKIW